MRFSLPWGEMPEFLACAMTQFVAETSFRKVAPTDPSCEYLKCRINPTASLKTTKTAKQSFVGPFQQLLILGIMPREPFQDRSVCGRKASRLENVSDSGALKGPSLQKITGTVVGCEFQMQFEECPRPGAPRASRVKCTQRTKHPVQTNRGAQHAPGRFHGARFPAACNRQH